MTELRIELFKLGNTSANWDYRINLKETLFKDVNLQLQSKLGVDSIGALLNRVQGEQFMARMLCGGTNVVQVCELVASDLFHEDWDTDSDDNITLIYMKIGELWPDSPLLLKFPEFRDVGSHGWIAPILGFFNGGKGNSAIRLKPDVGDFGPPIAVRHFFVPNHDSSVKILPFAVGVSGYDGVVLYDDPLDDSARLKLAVQREYKDIASAWCNQLLGHVVGGDTTVKVRQLFEEKRETSLVDVTFQFPDGSPLSPGGLFDGVVNHGQGVFFPDFDYEHQVLCKAYTLRYGLKGKENATLERLFSDVSQKKMAVPRLVKTHDGGSLLGQDGDMYIELDHKVSRLQQESKPKQKCEFASSGKLLLFKIKASIRKMAGGVVRDGLLDIDFAPLQSGKAKEFYYTLRFWRRTHKDGESKAIDLIEQTTKSLRALVRDTQAEWRIENEAGEEGRAALMLPVNNIYPAHAGGLEEEGVILNRKRQVVTAYTADAPLVFHVNQESWTLGQQVKQNFTIEKNKNAVLPQQKPLISLQKKPGLVFAMYWNAVESSPSGTNIVAARSTESINPDQWELQSPDPEQGVTLIMQTPGVGEQMEKGKVRKPQSSDVGEVPGDPEEGTVLDFRFAPPALLNFVPSYFDRDFNLAPWDLNAMLGKVGDRLPGVALLKADMEILYGLSARITSKSLWMVDEVAILGELPQPLKRAKVSKKLQLYMEAEQKIREQWLGRLAVQALRYDRAENPLLLDQGVNFRIRVTPGEDGAVKGAKLALPLHDSYKKEPFASVMENLKQYHTTHLKGGLGGGCQWGFESLAIYDEVWRNYRQSSSGELEQVRISCFGFWAKLTARFAQDKSVIKADVGMGRTHTYAVERIGRIAVFWLKAKHVILYERTTVPSLQFEGKQDPHVGRPIVRKVKEYVEILEDFRAFPDENSDDPTLTAFVKAAAFGKESLQIPVSSDWGRDIVLGDETGEIIGWEVPLWKPSAEQAIYPKPQPLLHLNGEGDEDVIGIIGNPEDVYFWTDTREEVRVDIGGGGPTSQNGSRVVKIGDNVHEWPSVFGVDFPLVVERPSVPDIPAADPTALDAQLPSDVAVPPEMKRFTFRLLTPERVNVAGVHHPESSMMARVRNVTMSRGMMVAEEVKELDKVQQWKDYQNVYRKVMYGNGSGELGLMPALGNGFTKIKGLESLDVDLANDAELAQNFSKGLIDALQWQGGGKSFIADLKNFDITKAPESYPDGKPNFQGIYEAGYSDNGLSGYSQTVFRKLWYESVRKTDQYFSSIAVQLDGKRKKLGSILEQRVQQAAGNLGEVKREVDRFFYDLENLHITMDHRLDSVAAAPQRLFQKFQNYLLGELHGASQRLLDGIGKAYDQSSTDQLKETLLKQVDKYKTYFEKFVEQVGGVYSNRVLKKLQGLMQGDTWVDEVEKAIKELHDKAKKFSKDLRSLIEKSAGQLNQSRDLIEEKIRQARGALVQFFNTQVLVALQEEMVTRLNKQMSPLLQGADALNEQYGAFVQETKEKVLKSLDQGSLSLRKAVSDVNELLKEYCVATEYDPTTGNPAGVSVHDQLLKWLYEELYRKGAEPVGGSEQTKDGVVYATLKQLAQSLGEGCAWVDGLYAALRDEVKDIETYFKEIFQEYGGVRDLYRAIQGGNTRAILAASEKLANQVSEDFGELLSEAADQARAAVASATAAEDAIQAGGQVLQNVRSLCDELTAPGLGFNRKTVALYFELEGNLEERIGITPCMAKLRNLDKSLDEVGLRLPFKSFGVNLNGYGLEKFDFGDIVSDLVAQYKGMFPGLKMPSWAKDHIKLTHGVDRQSMRAWAKAELDIKIPEKKRLLSLGPVGVDMSNTRFSGVVDIDYDIDGKMNKKAVAAVEGDMVSSLGGAPIVLFEQVKLEHKHGKLDVDLDPKKIKLPGVLKIIADATANLPVGDDEPFRVGVLRHAGSKMPTGVKAELNLPPFDVGAGTTSITGVQLGARFAVNALTIQDNKPKLDFSLATGFHLGKPEKPFNIAIFFLGGGGHITYDMEYWPKGSQMQITADVGINVSAVASFSAGFISGTVGMALGMYVKYTRNRLENGSSLAMGFRLLIYGNARVSILRMQIAILLEIGYVRSGSGGYLSGRGSFSVTIRFSRFFKKTLRRNIRKNLNKGQTRELEKASSHNSERSLYGLVAGESATAQSVVEEWFNKVI